MAWINGLNYFLDAAEAHRSSKGFMCCSCRFCRNNKDFFERNTLHTHLYERGFMDNYTLWTKHGEPGVLMEDDEDNDDDNNILDLDHLYEVGGFNDEPMDEAEENATEEVPHDDLGQVCYMHRKIVKL
ncbi:putative Tam1 transposon protein TNP2 [Panicum miliaceum]|uniref:Tam1 transposon protein TNP2 n=1 Tax=Panicum miliaceum TaxID=4540 RepID=A0A3L6T3F6_PANMI|nr:putative Tam1 transposon protein TNP2 [Panicum miliaceum]